MSDICELMEKEKKIQVFEKSCINPIDLVLLKATFWLLIFIFQ